MTVSTSSGEIPMAVTPSDSTIFPACRALYIGTTGDVAIVAPGASVAVVFKNVPVGVLPQRAIQVTATGTGASNIVAMY